jgi:hypothetical protein
MLEYQTRMLRLLSRVSAHPRFAAYREYATHGFRYLRDVMWDHEYGGWFRMLDRSGDPLEAATKHGHGASYGIDAYVAYHALTADPQALKLAHQAFAWLEHVGHDPEHGGYFALYQRDGTLCNSPEQCPIPGLVRDCIGTPLGFKDANTNGDMLETLADLCEVSPDTDPLVKTRLLEMLHVVRDRMIVAPGAVHMYFQPDWTPVPDFSRYSYGINTSNILAKAARSPCLEKDAKTLAVIKSVVDSVGVRVGPVAGRVLLRGLDFRAHLCGRHDRVYRYEVLVAPSRGYESPASEFAAQGESNKQIADRLGLSEHTVEELPVSRFRKGGSVESPWSCFSCCSRNAMARLRNGLGCP